MALRQQLTARNGLRSSPLSSRSVRPAAARPARAVAVRAVQLPSGVTAPKRVPQAPEAKFGFVYNAERLNSRACMLGFIGTLLVEAIAHKGVLEMVGLRVGQGLGFEF